MRLLVDQLRITADELSARTILRGSNKCSGGVKFLWRVLIVVKFSCVYFRNFKSEVLDSLAISANFHHDILYLNTLSFHNGYLSLGLETGDMNNKVAKAVSMHLANLTNTGSQHANTCPIKHPAIKTVVVKWFNTWPKGNVVPGRVNTYYLLHWLQFLVKSLSRMHICCMHRMSPKRKRYCS